MSAIRGLIAIIMLSICDICGSNNAIVVIKGHLESARKNLLV
jgi:hypothetical protein